MIYCKRDAQNKITGISNNQSPTFNEAIAEDDPEVIAFNNPPAATDEQRIDDAFPQTDTALVIFEAFFEIANRLQSLEGKQPITRTDLKNWLKSKLP